MKENRAWVALQVLHKIGGDRICQLYKMLFIDAFMLGWLDTGKVSLLDALYGKMIVSLVQRNKLA